MPILWGNGRLLLALAERCRTHPDPAALAVARRLGEYMRSTRPYYGRRENFEAVGGQYASGFTTCYPSLIDGLAALGDVTGDARFLEEARFIARLSLLDRAFAKHHSHGRLTAYRGMLDIDRFTGSREFTDTVRAACETITRDYLLPTGGITECFDRTDPRDEGCTEGDWVRVNLLLWQATGDPRYLDAAEHGLRNHVLAFQFGNGGFGHRDLRALTDGGGTYPAGGAAGVGYEAYWCCSMHGTQILADVARWGVVGLQDRVVVTWLAEARSTLAIGGRSITVTTRRQGPGHWLVLIDSPRPGEATLRLRVPGWAGGIVVDGEHLAPRDGWAELTRTWAGSVRLRVQFPTDVRMAGAYAPSPREGEPVRIFVGAEMLCLPDAFVDEAPAAANAVPAIVVAPEAAADAELAVVVQGKDGRSQRARLVPLYRRPPGGCRFLFRAKTATRAAFDEQGAKAAPERRPGRPVEIRATCNGEYEVYLSGTRLHGGTGGAGDCPRVEAFAVEPTAIVAVRFRSTAERPCMIAAVQAPGQMLVTRPEEGLTAVPCPDEVPADWLTDPSKGPASASKLADIGDWSSSPWKHVPAEFSGTDARWVWPEGPTIDSKSWWLVRFRLGSDDEKMR